MNEGTKSWGYNDNSVITSHRVDGPFQVSRSGLKMWGIEESDTYRSRKMVRLPGLIWPNGYKVFSFKSELYPKGFQEPLT